MSEAYHIISDGSCDLAEALAKEKDITVVPFYVSFDDEHYLKEGVEIGIRDFYQQMVERKGVYPKSSMPSAQDYAEAFFPYAKEGIPVICICITTKFSGSMQSALNAKALVLEEYPDAEITVIDSCINTVLQGLYVLEAAALRDSGMSYADTVKRLEEIKSTGRIFFTVGDMEYLKHGGRIGKVTAVAGSVLGIRPVITLKEGEIFPSGIGRGRKRTTEKALELLLEYLAEGLDADCYSIAIGYGYDYQEAEAFRAHTLEILHGRGIDIKEIPIFQIGATISVHTGPYPLGFGIIEKGIHQ
ncbi:DegV family protein [Acetatifactor muris]|uniref:DegV domain-containing protein n=1 Tax=Acetatifactor muris TaxID=879566 RepID=A0A2K4ZHH5_9FIRM|nr:DegV family protein [Acetatifactor muris]MCR2048040.1 DegV family protein [Acetatifactor muris]SOY29886.1 DegV domain-containing protein [Acetatifactor muris]